MPAALDDDFVVQVWDTDSGLPERIVTSIAQTPDGYLWIGTLHGGLARFDGVKFADFQPGNTPELKSIEIHNLFVDSQGTLWINNAEGGLISCRDGKFNFEHDDPDIPGSWLVSILCDDPAQLEFVSRVGTISRRTIRNGTNSWQTIPPPANSPLSMVCRDAHGLAWCLTTNGTVAQITQDCLVPVSIHSKLAGDRANTLVKDALGRIWIGTKTEIALWDGQTFVNMTPTNGEPSFNVEQMFPCPDGSFWVLGANQLRKCSGQSWRTEAKVWDADKPSETQRTDFFAGLSSLYPDSHGGIWFSHIRKGIGYVHPDGTVSWVRESQNIFTGGIRCWCEDHEGNIWIGLREGGLARLRPRVFHLVWPAAGAEDQSACSVCEDDNGTMFFGTQENQVLQWDHNSFSLVNLPAPGSFTEMKVMPADNGRLWIGSVRRGVLELSNGQCRAPFPPQAIGGVARCLYRDSRGALWIGSEFGLFRWSNGKLKTFSARDGYTPAYVLAITGDTAGDIWFGTALGELRRLHAGKFETFLPADSRTDRAALRAEALADPFNFRKEGALSGGERFWSLHFDADNVLWIGTLGGGLLRYENGKFTRFTTSDGLPSDNINQILDDGNGQLWLGTGAGIVRFAKSELDNFARDGKTPPNFVTYDKSDGLPALECYGGSEPNCWRDHDGKLWFTTVKGAGWIDPAVLRINRNLPQIHIEEFRLDGREQVEAGFPASLPATRPPQKITVAAGRHYYEFRFCASSLTSPEKVRFKWRLAGVEDNWVDGGNRNSANYSFVPPGHYQFQVLGCNNDGIWSDSPAVMDLTVLPYFWQQWWFKLAVGVLIAAALMAAYTIRISRLRMLEHLRLRIARDLHDEVGANLGSISLLAQIMEKKPSSADATQVHNIAAQTIDTLRDIIWFIDPTHDNLSDLVMRLQETARVMLSTVSYNFKQDGDFISANLSLAFRRNVPLIFKEVLHNLLRHSNASEAAITVQRTENDFQFQVRDNGAGFSPERRSSGNGMKNMKRRAQEIGGQLKVESAPGHGTTITLTAPIA